MLRKILTVLCVIGILGFSSVGFAKELSVGLGGIFNDVTITACHVNDQSFTISRRSLVYGGNTLSNIKIQAGDRFVVYDNWSKPLKVTFISFNTETCVGKFEM